MKKFYSLSIFLALFFSVLLVGNLEAATYYIDGSNGSDSKPGTLTLSWKTISKANSTLKAGDTVYIRAGTYNGQISPQKSGSSGNYITYQRYPGDPKYSVIISNNSYGANLTSKNYIYIDGLYFKNCGNQWIQMSNSDYCVIRNSKFYGAWGGVYSGISLGDGSQYNKILDNIFEDAPLSGDANVTAPADMINCSYDPNSSYNLIEGNTFGRSHHASIGAYNANHWVYRGNTFQNTFHTGLGPGGNALVEENYFYDIGDDFASNPGMESWAYVRIRHPAIQSNYSGSIIRKNIFDNAGTGIFIASLKNYEAHDNRIYSNTINKAVRNVWGEYTGTTWNLDDNIWKNNSLTEAYEIANEGDKGIPYIFYYRPGYAGAGSGNKWYNNNCYSSKAGGFRYRNTTDTLSNIQSKYSTDFSGAINISVDPKYEDSVNRDFALQSSSPMIDAGAWLTTITSATASGVTSFVVADPRYFYDGWGIPGETGDIIKTQNGAATTIQSINYDTHTITVSPAIDIVEGEGIALNYSGSAPDIGAYEYGDKTDMLSPPKGLELGKK